MLNRFLLAAILCFSATKTLPAQPFELPTQAELSAAWTSTQNLLPRGYESQPKQPEPRPQEPSRPAQSDSRRESAAEDLNRFVSMVPQDGSEIEFYPGSLVAIVGEEHILAGELLSMIEPMIVSFKGKASDAELVTLRQQLIRRALIETVQTKMLSQRFLSELVEKKPVAEREAARKQIVTQVNRAFYESYVPMLMQENKASDEVELDRILREKGSSIEGLKLTFFDGTLASEMMQGLTTKKINIDILAMRDRYESQIQDWQRPARAKFQLMSVEFRNFKSKQAASSEIQGMFEEVRTGGANFESVAKRRSQGVRSEEGGLFDWTNQGSLRSGPIDDALFSIPLNRLSNYIEDEQGIHVIVVLQREPARVLPFAEAQEEIRKKLAEERRSELRQEFLDKMRDETAVWSLWPEDIANARPLSDAIAY